MNRKSWTVVWLVAVVVELIAGLSDRQGLMWFALGAAWLAAFGGTVQGIREARRRREWKSIQHGDLGDVADQPVIEMRVPARTFRVDPAGNVEEVRHFRCAYGANFGAIFKAAFDDRVVDTVDSCEGPPYLHTFRVNGDDRWKSTCKCTDDHAPHVAERLPTPRELETMSAQEFFDEQRRQADEVRERWRAEEPEPGVGTAMTGEESSLISTV